MTAVKDLGETGASHWLKFPDVGILQQKRLEHQRNFHFKKHFLTCP